jgi:hypothetical protein
MFVYYCQVQLHCRVHTSFLLQYKRNNPTEIVKCSIGSSTTLSTKTESAPSPFIEKDLKEIKVVNTSYLEITKTGCGGGICVV